jgi:hypothetical protein
MGLRFVRVAHGNCASLVFASLGGVAARFVPLAQAAHAAGFAESSLASLTESALRLISLIPAPAGAGLVLPAGAGSTFASLGRWFRRGS